VYVLVLALVALEVPLVVSLRARVSSEVRSQAEGQADLVASSVADVLGRGSRRDLARLASVAAASVRGRVIVVDARGRLIADSAGPAELGSAYASRPEVRAALGGRREQVQRLSRSVGEELLATAVPVERRGRTVGAVRITQSVAAVRRALARVTLELALLGLVVLGLGVAAGVVVARQLARPIIGLERAARRVAAGDLDARADTGEGSAEQRSLARSFNEMTARVGRMLERQRDFVADASHQLRTPLTGARLRIDEARSAGVSEDAERELAAGADEVDRMGAIIDELLLLSRLGERRVPAESVPLADAVRRAAERWAPVADAAGVRIAVNGVAAAGTAMCAPPDLDRALDALVENALCYGADGGEVVLAAGPNWIEVRDRGPGLAAGEEAAVWERFHRGRSGRAGPAGTGLGLPIARALAAEWGGDASLRNRNDGGAVARLEFNRGGGKAQP
jgi:signal transduction histidine kinase